MSLKNVFTPIFICCLSFTSSAEPQLAVQLDRSAIYEGESFHYQLIVSDTSPINANVTPDTSTWTDFDAALLGKQSLQQGGGFFSMTINGQTVRNDRTALTYQTRFNYVLIPKRTGSLTIPLPKVTMDGKALLPQSFSVDEGSRQMLTDYSVAVQVLGAEEQDIVFMSIETSRNRLYPLQPLDVTLVIQIKGLPDRYAGSDPLTVPRQPWQPPQLQIPWAEGDLKGFLSPQTLETWLTGFLVKTQRGGFAINNYTGGRDVFSMSFASVPLQFSSTPRRMKRFDALGNETTYWEYRFTRTLLPQEFGHYSFGPVTLKGALPVVDPNVPDGVVWKKLYALAKPVTVTVTDVPQENRPADYIGAFGVLRWDVNLTPQKAKVGDPLTLTLCLSGEGSMANVRPLDLSVNPDVAANFRVHMPPTEEVNERSCIFTYTIRPQRSGEMVFPPISVSVFDVSTERFVSLQSLPIPLEIADSETVQSATLFGNVPSDAGKVQIAEGGLFANKTALSETLPPITFSQWAAVVSLLAGGYAMIAVGVLLLRCQWANPKQQRRRGALNRAKSRLSGISSVLRKKDTANLVDLSNELQGVFFGYIADKRDSTDQGMTTSDACQKLSENRVPETLVSAIRTVLESLDAVKYGGMDVRSLDELTHTAAVLLQQLDRVAGAGDLV